MSDDEAYELTYKVFDQVGIFNTIEGSEGLREAIRTHNRQQVHYCK